MLVLTQILLTALATPGDRIFVEVTGEAGAGLVKVRMRGDMAVSGVEVDPSLMQEPREILEDLLAAAVNDAVRRAQAAAQECMASVTSGINLPDGFKMPI